MGKNSGWSLTLKPGMKGIFVTCAMKREDSCMKEAIDLFQEYAKQLYGEKIGSHVKEEENNEEDSREEDDAKDEDEDSFEDSLKKELESLKRNRFRNNGRGGINNGNNSKKGDGVSSLIHAVKSPAPSTIFIRLLDPIDPVTMVMQILNDNFKSGNKTSRFIQRLIPAQESCACSTADFERTFRSYFESYVARSQGGGGDDNKIIQKYSVVFKSRFNNSLTRQTVLTAVRNIIDADIRVDLENPDIFVLVEIVKGTCMMSIVRDYDKLKRFNVQSIYCDSLKGKVE